MLGMLFSERTIGEQSVRFCNLHSWYVGEEYRGKSLLLLQQALRLKDHTLTDFTPSERVSTIYARFGFQTLDSALRVLLPFGITGKRDADNVEVTQDEKSIAVKLSLSDSRLFQAHQVRHCEHLLVVKDDQYCYLICSKVNRYFLPYRQIQYISNKALFEQALPQIRPYLLAGSDVRFAAVEDRLVPGLKLPMSFRMPMQNRQLYRPCDVRPGEIDGLHSEVSLLGLSTLPSLTYPLRRLANRVRIGGMPAN